MAIFLFRKPKLTKTVIALGSIEHGTGVTTISLALSNFLCSKLGRKVAYIELNATQQIASLSPGTGTEPFSYKGIRIFPHTTITSLPELLGQDFDVFVLDIGVLNAYTAKEFAKGNRQFLICSLSAWKAESTTRKLCKLIFDTNLSNLTGIIGNSCIKESKLMLSDRVCFRPLPAPFISNPFQLPSELFPFFEEILGKGY